MRNKETLYVGYTYSFILMSPIHFVYNFTIILSLSLSLSPDPSGVDEIRYYFTLSSEKGVIKFGCVTSAEREQWVQWLTRATGQTDKPKDNKPSEEENIFNLICYYT